ncbi:MAG: hypothetical protein PVH64_02130 [Bacillota bacterium]|jgi:hypothetical protein
MMKLPVFPTVGKTLKNSGAELYRSLGYSLVTSLIWFLAFTPILYIILMIPTALAIEMKQAKNLMDAGMASFFGIVVVALLNGLLTGPVTTALFALFQEKKEGYPNIWSFFKCLVRIYWLSARVHLVCSLLVSVLFFNLLVMVADQGLLMKVCGIFSIYGLILLMLLSLYIHPLIFYQKRFGSVFKKAFLLTLDNMGISVLLGLAVALIFLVSLGLIFPVLLLFGALYIYLLDNGFELIAQKYETINENGVKEE